MEKRIATMILALCLAVTAVAQPRQTQTFRHIFNLNWQNSIPLGGSAEVVSRYSFAGLDFNYTFYISPNFGVGVDVAWNHNDLLVPAQEYHPLENVALYAPGYKKTSMTPLKAQFKYMINPYSSVKVYLGAGLGAASMVAYKQVQEIQIWDDSWGFLMSPEVGILVPFGKRSNWGLNVNAGYNWATNHAQNIYLSLGIYFGAF